MEIIMIAAMSKNRAIGKENSIPWHLKEDFEFFKQTTLTYPIIMGKNTFNSLKKPLPNRENIILTRFPIPGMTCFDNINDALEYCYAKDYDKAFLIGGASVYEEGLKFANTILLTEIDKEFHADTFFPELNSSEWKIVEMQKAYSEENDFNYSFNTYKKQINL
tara:strand:- start:3314 stop:3802 length:489 start_codon:yes stop_codon:yes gene_type:complete